VTLVLFVDFEVLVSDLMQRLVLGLLLQQLHLVSDICGIFVR